MRSRLLILTVGLIPVLFNSCSRNEGALNANHDQRVVSGQVVMAGSVPNSSPEGVEVSVEGTRMCATLSSDGWFSFVGVAPNAEITFRRADGVNARLHTGRLSAAPRVIELSRKQVEVRGSRPI
jgi:hypothetical protein